MVPTDLLQYATAIVILAVWLMSIVGTAICVVTWIRALVHWCTKRGPRDMPFAAYMAGIAAVWVGGCMAIGLETLWVRWALAVH